MKIAEYSAYCIHIPKKQKPVLNWKIVAPAAEQISEQYSQVPYEIRGTDRQRVSTDDMHCVYYRKRMPSEN